jgi:hypothetical protein
MGNRSFGNPPLTNIKKSVPLAPPTPHLLAHVALEWRRRLRRFAGAKSTETKHEEGGGGGSGGGVGEHYLRKHLKQKLEENVKGLRITLLADLACARKSRSRDRRKC